MQPDYSRFYDHARFTQGTRQAVIVEQRTYDIVPGKLGQYMDWYRTFGVAVQVRHLGCLLGYYQTELGDLNQVVHLWQYRDFADRTERRARLFADPQWFEFFDRAIAIIVRQRSTILTSPCFVAPQPAKLVLDP